ncbi:MAG: hypothetical protein ABSD96_01090 [Candidatus Korobacteraceae bacterium]|jgi:hypothetical protein
MALRVKFGACLLVFCAVLAAQAREPAVATDDVTPETADTAHLSGGGPSLVTRSDPDYRNVLFGSASFGASFDTEGFTNPNGSTSSDFRFFAQPSVAFRQTRPTTNWTLSYTPGVSVGQHETDTTEFTHNLAADGVWKVTPRLTLHARQDYSISTNPFESVGRVALLPDLGGYFGPNYDGVLPSTKRTSYVTNADISYRMTPHTAIGITGGYQQFDYGSINAIQLSPASLIDSTVVNGSIFVSYQMSKRQTLGVQLAYTDIYSNSTMESRVQAPAVLLFDTIKLTPHSTLSAFAGPQYARSSTVVPTTIGGVPGEETFAQRDWHPSAGVTYIWTGTHDAVNLQFSRRISSGGGLMNANTMTFGSAAFRSRFTKRWTAEARLSVDNEDEIDLINQNVYFQTVWTGGSLAREVNRHCTIRMDGAYVRQTGAGLGFAPGNHGLIQLTVDVHFLKGLGQ